MAGKLTVETDDGSVTFGVVWAGRDAFDGRDVWCWSVECVDGRCWSAEDLRVRGSAVEALRSLLGFASACAEAVEYAARMRLPVDEVEAAGLFPLDCAGLLDAVGSDALALLADETCGGEA